MTKTIISNKKNLFIGLLVSLLLIAADQLTKYFAVINLKDGGPFVIIPGVFELRYLENRGAAFGIMQNQIWFFIIATLLILAAVTYLYVKMPKEKKFRYLRIVCMLITAGAIGNLIDRIRLNYVIDFLYFSLIDFPIFNVADCYVTISAAALFILFIFYYKDEDLEFLPFFGSKNPKEMVNLADEENIAVDSPGDESESDGKD